MKTRIYKSRCQTLELTYKGSVLKRINVLKEDKVAFDALRHKIPLYRQELSYRLFERVTKKQGILNSEITISRSAQFIGWVIALGGLSNLSLLLYSYQLFWLAMGAGLLFVFGVSALFWSNGNR